MYLAPTMPRPFTDDDKTDIRNAMKLAGLKHFERAGLRAARVDDICRDVGIAKGSFYAFFDSKEDLFMAIVVEREEQHRQDVYAFIKSSTGSQATRAKGLFDLILGKIEADPILNLIVVSNEIPHLVRKLGPDRFAQSQRDGEDFAREAARLWHAGGGKIRAEDLLGLMTICLSVAVQRRQITGGQYAPTIALLRELFVARLTGGKK